MIKKILTVPNILSFMRILLIPLFAYLYFTGYIVSAVMVLLFSGFTDILDGVIARRFNMVSAFGKFIDPCADKLTQGIVVVCLAIRHPIVIPLLVLFYAKELTMALGALMLYKSGKQPSGAKWWGKIATCSVYLTLFSILMSDIFNEIPQWALITVMVITAICIMFSLFSYYPIFKDIQEGKYKE